MKENRKFHTPYALLFVAYFQNLLKYSKLKIESRFSKYHIDINKLYLRPLYYQQYRMISFFLKSKPISCWNCQLEETINDKKQKHTIVGDKK
jgi:hypothetical protein